MSTRRGGNMDHRRGKVKRSTGSHSRSASFPSRLPSSSPSSSCSAPSRRSLICRVPPKASPTSVPRVASGGAGGLPVTVEALLRDRATQKPLLCRWAACFFRALRSRPFWFLSATKPGKRQRRGIYTHTRQRRNISEHFWKKMLCFGNIDFLPLWIST